MRRNIPSLNALRAFEAAARHGSFAKAADELLVTPGAVSQQVAGLEAHLGIRLFDRVKKRLHLTDAGRAYLPPLNAALDRMEAATVDLLTHEGRGGDLTVGSLPTFAERWLIPRLPAFQASHPEIRINLVTMEVNFATPFREPDLRGGQIDIGLFFGDGHWPDLHSTHLMRESLIPVMAPTLADSNQVTFSPDEILALPLLHHSTRPNSWYTWAQIAGATIQPSPGHSFEHFFMLIEAVRAGLGIALLPAHTITNELQAGTLVQVHDRALTSGHAYYIIHETGRDSDPRLQAFKNWLFLQPVH